MVILYNMKFFSFFTVQLLFLVFFIILTASSATPKAPKRSKHASFYGITPSLRVGRRSRWGTFNSDTKRYGKLMAFPRVGRGGAKTVQTDDNYGKRAGSNTGMWFGPRLGRLQKRNIALDNNQPWTYIIFNDLPYNRQTKYNPQLDSELDDVDSEEYKEIPTSSAEEEQSA